MLVLTRRVGDEIVIGENIRLSVVRVERGKVRLGIAAPAAVCVRRAEIRALRPSGLVGMPGPMTAEITTTGKS